MEMPDWHRALMPTISLSADSEQDDNVELREVDPADQLLTSADEGMLTERRNSASTVM